MITRIEKDDSAVYKVKRGKLTYLLFDEDTTAEFGFISLSQDGSLNFKLIEDKYLSFEEVEIIDEFMKKIRAIESGDELNTLSEVYYFGSKPV